MEQSDWLAPINPPCGLDTDVLGGIFTTLSRHCHLHRLLLAVLPLPQLVVLTPYLAQLRELRDAMDGTVSAQDASDLAAAIRLGDGNTDQGGGRGSGGGGGDGGGGAADSRSRVRVATGERGC